MTSSGVSSTVFNCEKNSNEGKKAISMWMRTPWGSLLQTIQRDDDSMVFFPFTASTPGCLALYECAQHSWTLTWADMLTKGNFYSRRGKCSCT